VEKETEFVEEISDIMYKRKHRCCNVGTNNEGILFFTFIPCILILSKFYLFTNWCASEFS